MINPTSRRPHCYRVLANAVRPRERLTVSDWADRHRILSTKQSSMSGRWRTSVNPLLGEIMDALSATSPVRELVVMKSNQVGITEAMVNALGYIMHHAPGPCMVLMPTLADRDTWKVQKLNPLLQDTTAVRELLGGLRSRDAANRQDLIDFPGGVLFLSGGNSPNSYAQKSARWVMMDDLDRFPAEIGSEGDPVSLARGRVKAFPHKHKLMLVSTPTIKEVSIIEREYLDSDRRRYLVPCPHCAQLQPLNWEQVRYERVSPVPQSAWYECANCQEPIDETFKPQLLRNGRWVAERPESRRRGYHINALYAPIGLGPSWLDLAREWVSLHRGSDGKSRKAEPALLKAFVNLHLGQTWEDQAAAVKPHHLARREDDVQPGEIPPGVLALTAGIDTQDTWLDVTLLGWRQWQDDGTAGWRVIEWVKFHGDTSRKAVWDELEAYLHAPRVNAYGQSMRINAAGIDNRGHRGEQVKAFSQRESLKIEVFRVQGAINRQAEIIRDNATSVQKDWRGKARKNSWGIWNVGTEGVKDIIYSALASDEDQPPDERRIRFPAGMPSEYYTGLLAEVKNPETRRYEQRRGADYQRNEPLDGMVYGIAVGFQRSVMIGMRRTIVRRSSGPGHYVKVPDNNWWRRKAAELERETPKDPPPENPPDPPQKAQPQDEPKAGRFIPRTKGFIRGKR
jgi:phage terminase large subunit GpA-like protein